MLPSNIGMVKPSNVEYVHKILIEECKLNLVLAKPAILQEPDGQ